MIALLVKMRDGHTHVVSCATANEVSIGRAIGNEVLLPDAHVSSRHARIVLRDGKYIIVDLKSSNGTYVNGKRISSPQVLKDGDKIYVGDFTLALTADVHDAIGPSELPGWMRPVTVEQTAVHAPPAPPPVPPPPPRPQAPPAPSSDFDDEVTPAVGTPMVKQRTPQVTHASGGRRTVIDDDVALGLVPVPPGPTPRATLDVRVGGVSLSERVRDDGVLVVFRGKASGRDARIVQLSDAMRDDPEGQAMLNDASKLAALFRSPRLPRFLAADPGLLATSPPPGVATLHEIVKRHGSLAPHVALHIATDVARALAEFHETRDDDGTPLGLVHRSLTLRHIEIARDGAVQLDGFVFSRSAAPWRAVRTRPGTLKGSILSMAPEQVRGLVLDARADLWALGIALYTMVSGANPLRGETEFDTLELVRNGDIPPLAQAPALQPALDALFKRNRDERTPSARAALTLFERAALELPPASRLDVERLVR